MTDRQFTSALERSSTVCDAAHPTETDDLPAEDEIARSVPFRGCKIHGSNVSVDELARCKEAYDYPSTDEQHT